MKPNYLSTITVFFTVSCSCEWDTCSHFWNRDPDCHFVFQSNTKLNEVSILENKINWVLLGRAIILLCSCKYRTNISRRWGRSCFSSSCSYWWPMHFQVRHAKHSKLCLCSGFLIKSSAGASTASGSLNYNIMLFSCLDCHQNKEATKKNKIRRTIRRVATWQDCREECNKDDNCVQFNFKVV